MLKVLHLLIPAVLTVLRSSLQQALIAESVSSLLALLQFGAYYPLVSV